MRCALRAARGKVDAGLPSPKRSRFGFAQAGFPLNAATKQ
jgi:hypothetical protein